jgi:Bacterial PH domain
VDGAPPLAFRPGLVARVSAVIVQGGVAAVLVWASISSARIAEGAWHVLTAVLGLFAVWMLWQLVASLRCFVVIDDDAITFRNALGVKTFAWDEVAEVYTTRGSPLDMGVSIRTIRGRHVPIEALAGSSPFVSARRRAAYRRLVGICRRRQIRVPPLPT